MKYVPFTVVIPAVLPQQKAVTHELSVEVDDSEGLDILTPDAHRRIDHRKMQGMLTMLYGAVKILAEMKRPAPMCPYDDGSHIYDDWETLGGVAVQVCRKCRQPRPCVSTA